MTVFLSTLNQMAFLMLLIVIGFVLSRLSLVQSDGARLLSKLENYVFIPSLVMGTFMQNFTVERISVAGQYFACGFVVILISMPLAVALSRAFTNDKYIRNIYAYGLAFSNFGFMGNAVVSALFPEIFMEYLIFVLPFWIFIYIWGVPYLLIPSENSGKKRVIGRLKNLINPMFIAMIAGMIIGLTKLPLPSFFSSAVSNLGNCMSPIAMLLTGMTIAKINLKDTFKNGSIYLASIVRLLIIPCAAILILSLIPIPEPLALCIICSLAMPLGLNSIVVPSAYGRDTTAASGMALISHLFSCITIPIIFMVFDFALK